MLDSAFSGARERPDYFYYRAKIAEAKGELALAYAYAAFAAERSSDGEADALVSSLQLALVLQGRNLTELDPATDRLIEFSEKMPVSELSLAGAFLTGLGALVMLLRTRSHRPFGRVAAFTGLCFFVTLCGLAIQLWADSHPPVFVIQEGMARSGPSSAFLEVLPVRVGAKYRLIRSEKDWVRLRLGRLGAEGYVPASHVLIWPRE